MVLIKEEKKTKKFSFCFYLRLFQCYAEEHSIQDLLFYLSDGVQRRSIHFDIYLKVKFFVIFKQSISISFSFFLNQKNVRELSRRQFVLRATMRKCRQIAGLPIK